MNEEQVFHRLEEKISGSIISADPPVGSSRYPKISFLKSDGPKGTRYIPDMIILKDRDLVIIEIKPNYKSSDISKLRDMTNMNKSRIESRLERLDVKNILDINANEQVTDYFDNIRKCFVFSGDIPNKTPTDVILVRINKKNIEFINNFGVFN